MRNMTTKFWAFTILVTTFTMFVTINVFGQNFKEEFNKKTFERGIFYFAIEGVYPALAGDFDGIGGYAYIDDPNKVCVRPKIDPRFGGRIVFGEIKNALGGELSYSWSAGHQATGSVGAVGGIHTLNDQATLNELTLDVKYFFLGNIQSAFRLYLLGGGVYTSLKVKNAGKDLGDDLLYDAVFSGFGYRIGGGINFKLTEKILFEAGGVYRWVRINNINTFGKNLNYFEDTNPIGTGVIYNIGLKYLF